MKLTSVELQPENTTSVAVLSYRDPGRENPYNVEEIQGLNAEDISSNYYGTSSAGAKFYTMTLLKRDIVIKVRLNPRFELGESYSDLRDDLYRLISSSRTGRLQLRFLNGLNVVAGIFGFIAKLEAPQFDKTQEAQITISCDDPILRALTPTTIPPLSLNPSDAKIVDNVSTAPHGFAFQLNILNPMASITITDPQDGSWSFVVTPVGGFLSGDVVWFSSEANNKYIMVYRLGQFYQMADVVQIGSMWPIIFPGENHFTFGNAPDLQFALFLHYPTYWGV